jgi:hypothetical protein
LDSGLADVSLRAMVDEPDPAPVFCARCGRPRADASPAEALTWVLTHDERGRSWLCAACARTHVRDIEGKLPDAYW